MHDEGEDTTEVADGSDRAAMINLDRCNITKFVSPNYIYAMGLLRIRVCGRLRLSTLLLFLFLCALFIFLLNSHSTHTEHIEEDILNPKYLQLQASYRRKIASKFHFDQDDTPVQMCRVPKLSLKSDVNQFAFHSMEELECSRQELFTLKDYMLKIKPNVLKTGKLERCLYKAIEWETDNDYRFSEQMERKAPRPFELKIKNEFFHVECYLEKTNETQDEMTSLEQKYRYAGDGMRRLLQVVQVDDEKHQAKWRVASDQAINQVVQRGTWSQKRIKDIVQKVQDQQNGALRSTQRGGFVNSNQNLGGRQQQIPQGQQNLVGLQQQIPQAQQNLAGLQQQIPQGQQNFAGLQQQIPQGQQNLAGLQQQIPQGQQNFAGLQQQIPQGQQNLAGLQQQLPQGQQNLAGLQQQIPQGQQNLAGLQQQLPQAQQNLAGLQQQIAQGQQQPAWGSMPRYMGSVGLPDSPLIDKHAKQVYNVQRGNQGNVGALQDNLQQQQQQGQNPFLPSGQVRTNEHGLHQNPAVVNQQQHIPQHNAPIPAQQQHFVQGQTQNIAQGQSQNFAHGQSQNVAQGQAQNLAQGRVQDFGQNHGQSLAHGQVQNVVPTQGSDIRPIQGAQNQAPVQNQNVPNQPDQTPTEYKQKKGPNSIQAIKQKQDEDKSIDLTHLSNSDKPKPIIDEPELKAIPASSKKEMGAKAAEADYKEVEPGDYPADHLSTEVPDYQYHDFHSNYDFDSADFEQFFAQVVPKEDVLKRVREVPKVSEQMNVLIFAMDSMSHLTYQRKLPKTYEYIQKKLGSVVLNGYNIVGDATTAAIIPMTTGRTELELPEVRKNKEGSTYVDAYPLIWNKFEQRGYVTLYTEDKPDIAVFNLRLNGFEEIPTDHYMRPFYQAVLKSSMKEASEGYCTGGTPSHVYMLDYLKQFFERYPTDVNKFAFGFLSDLSHDDNNPAEYIDQDLLNFLESLRRKGHLDNTVVILMGDHGARYSAIRKTTQGKLEERLPMMSLAFPPWFQKKYPTLMEHLRANADRLTTPFDIHATLLSIVDLGTLQKPLKKGARGRSLLRTHPLNRTCSDAGVDAHWCTCMNWQHIDPGNVRVQRAAAVLMEYINSKSSQHRDICSELTLKGVTDVKIGLPNEKVLKYLESSDGDQRVANFTNDLKSDLFYLQVIIETVPGHGLYEGTLTLSDHGETYKVVPGISRINKYGSQAHCVTENHPDLRIFCHCAAPPPTPLPGHLRGHRAGRAGVGIHTEHGRS